MSDSISSVPEPLVTSDPDRMGGAPVFAGTRIPVRLLFEFLEDGAPLDEFLTSYPDVTREHAVAVLRTATAALIISTMGQEPYEATADELAAIDEAEAQLARGKRVPKSEVDAFWRRHGL
jgi:uncharacterized protein (DUF433 family)